MIDVQVYHFVCQKLSLVNCITKKTFIWESWNVPKHFLLFIVHLGFRKNCSNKESQKTNKLLVIVTNVKLFGWKWNGAYQVVVSCSCSLMEMKSWINVIYRNCFILFCCKSWNNHIENHFCWILTEERMSILNIKDIGCHCTCCVALKLSSWVLKSVVVIVSN